MQTSICEVCLKSDLLCNVCLEKLKKGHLNEKEIDVIRFLYNLSNKIKSLEDVKLVKVIDSDILVIISGKGDTAKLVGKGGSVVKELAKEFKKSVKIIEQSENFKEFIHNFLSPVAVNGINTIFTPKGEIFRIRISNSQKNRLPISYHGFSQVMENLYNSKAEIVFE